VTVLRLRAAGLTWLETDGELVALDEQAATYLSGNPAATLLWPELAAGATKDDLVEALLDGFEIDRARAEADVEAFVADLQARNLLLEEQR
jgi:hypothetical protein